MKRIIKLFFILYTLTVNAQKTIVINNKGTKTEANKNTVTTAATAPASPVEGDIWFDTTVNVPKVWDKLNWKEFMKYRFGDIKYGLQSGDHNGWVVLDGRAINSLPAAQQTQATALGFSTNLPNAEDKTLMMRNIGNVGDTGGAIEILQQNLPNVTFTGTTTSITPNRGHNHTGIDTYAAADTGTGNVRWHTRAGNTTTTRTTSTAGNHSHTATAPSGGSGTAVDYTPNYIYVNVFIFLGN